MEEGIHPRDGKPWVQPQDRADWRAWLGVHHATSRGVHFVTWRRASGHPPIPYADAVEEALCVGWIDSKAGTLDDQRSTLWMSPRRPKSGWSRPNKDRIERLVGAGLMLPAGVAAVEDARRRGTWTLLDDVEDLVVPDVLAIAFAARPGSADHWDGFPRSTRRALLEWIVQAKRPETRARRIQETADRAARNERTIGWTPKP